MAGKAGLRVTVDIRGIPEMAAALTKFRDGLTNRVMKSGAIKGARRTMPTAKSVLSTHKRTGQLIKSQTVKYKGYKQGWVVMLGPRHGFAANAPSWMSTGGSPRIDPAKYAHLLDGGRKENKPKKPGGAMPIFVKKLDLRRRGKAPAGVPNGKIPWKTAAKYGAGKLDNLKGKARKVPGGWLLFTQFARQAPAYPWLAKTAPAFERNIVSSVISECHTAIPRLAAQYYARGSSPLR